MWHNTTLFPISSTNLASDSPMASPAVCRAWGRNAGRLPGAASLSSTDACKFNLSKACRARLFFSSCRTSGFSKLHRESDRSLRGSISRSTAPCATSTRGLSTSSTVDGRTSRNGIEFRRPHLLYQQFHDRRSFQHMASGPGEQRTMPKSTNAPASSTPPQDPSKPPTSSSKPPDAPPSDIPTQAEQRRSDWSIIKRLMINVWPKNDWKTRWTVILGFALLVSAKVRRVYILVIYS